MKKMIVFYVLLLTRATLFASVTMPSVFSNGMVLQRDTTVAVWGWATANATVDVTVSWNEAKKFTFLADAKGLWKGRIETPGAGGPYRITISDGTPLVIKNVLIGEVWLYSGQSNMARRISALTESVKDPALADADYPMIRNFTVKQSTSKLPADNCSGTWTACSKDNAATYSAIAFFSARELHKKLNVPIGIINSSYGGSSNEAWLAEEDMQDMPALKAQIDKIKAGSLSLTHQLPTTLFNAMLNPLIPFTVKGVCWYQGEFNTKDATDYQALLNKLVDSWRRFWNNDNLPFLIAQLSGYASEAQAKPDWVKVQLIQYKISQLKQGVATVLTYDKGDRTNIHPNSKDVVGHRFFLAACRFGYQDDIICQGPDVQNARFENGKVILTFGNTGEGLKSLPASDVIPNFYLAPSTGTYTAAKARIIHPNKVEITVPAGMQAEYAAYCNQRFNPDVNLYSSADLPVVPFEGLKIESESSAINPEKSFSQEASVIYLSEGNPQLLLKLNTLSEIRSDIFDMDGRFIKNFITRRHLSGEHDFPLSGVLPKHRLCILRVVINSVTRSFLVKI